MLNSTMLNENVEPLYSGGGGDRGGLNLPLPVPFNPGSRPVFLGSCPFAIFRLQNIAQCCVIFPFFSRFPPPWESHFPPPLLSPPVHLPPLFLQVSHPPVPPYFISEALIGFKNKTDDRRVGHWTLMAWKWSHMSWVYLVIIYIHKYSPCKKIPLP